MSVATPVRRRQQIVVAATLVCAASMLGLGLWAFLDPPSFAGFVDFAPYNEHLIHDAGAFQVGIGTALLVALWWPDGLVVALTGFAVASGLHTVSHAIDRQLGGHGSDGTSLGLLTRRGRAGSRRWGHPGGGRRPGRRRPGAGRPRAVR